ncbi:unnamed protein product [Cyclocybe aegerita]|uniref:Uncharacterized protein n=1 Tax=Cyclocybe aegerita TaxID=1973307 RepID=A0A8S0X380_CYCAE|nr:unnamed protein product [Cyclocybe aegerita]
MPAAPSSFDTQVDNVAPVRLLGKTIPLPDVEDETFPIGVVPNATDIARSSSSSALGLVIPPPGQEFHAPKSRDSARRRQSAPQNSSVCCPLPTEILQICDSLPHRLGCSWRNLELGHRWSNQTTLSLLCPLLVHQARRLLLQGKSTLIDVTFGQLYEDPAQPRPILRGPSVMKLEHLESMSVTSSANLAFLFDKKAVELPKLKRLSLTSRRGSCSGLSGPVVLDQALDIPWASFESLYLANESSSSCDILLILSKCSRLRQFSWSGDLERFAVPGRLPALKLSHLEELSISSSSEGCNALVNTFPKEIIWNITKGSFTSLPSALSRSNYVSLTHLAVHDPIPLEKLVAILRELAKLEHGEFAVINLPCSRSQGINTRGRVPRKALRHLELSTTTSLIPLWNSLLCPNINTISLSTPNHCIDLIDDIQPFLSRYSNAAIIHTYNTPVHTWNLRPVTPSWS